MKSNGIWWNRSNTDQDNARCYLASENHDSADQLTGWDACVFSPVADRYPIVSVLHDGLPFIRISTWNSWNWISEVWRWLPTTERKKRFLIKPEEDWNGNAEKFEMIYLKWLASIILGALAHSTEFGAHHSAKMERALFAVEAGTLAGGDLLMNSTGFVWAVQVKHDAPSTSY